MRVDVVTIFPEYLSPLDLSLVGKARAAGLLDLRVHDLRSWTTDRHRTVDDSPLGGGAGMVMRPDVWGLAVDDVLGLDAGADHAAGPGAGSGGVELVVPTPSGEVFTQRTAERLAGANHLVVACGRYEGIDARVAEHYRSRGVRVTELSIGDYVLNGGEVAALVVVEAVARLLPGVVGNPHSLVEESHGATGLLEYPVYTRPPQWRGHEVPEVLLSGHHARIERWRRDQALERTARRRPDLVRRLRPEELDRADRAVLGRLGWDVGPDGPEPAAPGADDTGS
ncbi:tRNA (guanosine(37)-N1)-methyltransferase TrmD [Actinotalea ferrariae]|uniref:tRNA (guanosine(37)-N1)-methyltransferase TrmD n=1 Tax=Actinotalea ferrariae TaxID=1386098 RepID=UPI001C8B4B70|nr:tRNA (guanosine(37)-N1)-methyltransferase TrmD [Actinotalea ferrariae]MBX9245363.1 tRNA (guanosine(37)-N1)-methyltransferase TrmD [Actinotalea ferrariae]